MTVLTEGISRPIEEREKERDLQYLQQFKDVNLGKVGKKIGHGREHRVYLYNQDKVIKIPRPLKDRVKTLFLLSTAEEKAKELNAIKEYFPQYWIDTSLINANDSPDYYLIQERLDNFEILRMENLQDVSKKNAEAKTIKEQFLDLIQQNRKLFVEKHTSLDILGAEGFQTNLLTEIPPLSNIVITHSEENGYQLKIIDPGLFLAEREFYQESDKRALFMRLRASLSVELQRQVIKKYYQIDVVRDEGQFTKERL